MMLVLALVFLAGSFAVLVAVRSYLGERSDFERWPPSQISAHTAATGIAGLEQVSFRSTDGTAIAGWYVPSRNRAAVVLVHGTNADRAALLAETRILAHAGFGALALDLPGQGASGGRSQWGAAERHAVSAAVGWLAEREDVDPDRIGGLGVSLGGVIVLQTAVSEPRLEAVALVATPSDVMTETRLASGRWGWLSSEPAAWALELHGDYVRELQPVEIIAALAPRPVMIIGGQLDTWVPPSMESELYAAAREPKVLWIVPGGHHADFAAIDLREYSARLTEFFSGALLR
jgi:dipeptidyl aminopeptidase/acylaminoacyl peptidase